MKYIKGLVDVKVFEKNLVRAWREMCLNKLTVVTVEEVINGHYGESIPEMFCEIHDIRNEDGFLLCQDKRCEVYWEDWMQVLEDCTDDLQEIAVEMNLREGYPHAQLFLTMNDNDGSLDIQLMVCDDFWENHFYCEECGEVYSIQDHYDCTRSFYPEEEEE